MRACALPPLHLPAHAGRCCDPCSGEKPSQHPACCGLKRPGTVLPPPHSWLRLLCSRTAAAPTGLTQSTSTRRGRRSCARRHAGTCPTAAARATDSCAGGCCAASLPAAQLKLYGCRYAFGRCRRGQTQYYDYNGHEGGIGTGMCCLVQLAQFESGWSDKSPPSRSTPAPLQLLLRLLFRPPSAGRL